MKTGEITSTPIFNPLDYHWIGQNVLLSVGPQGADLPPISVSLYDLETHQYRNLTDQGLSVHPSIPHAIQISPDNMATAFIEDQTADLYVIICHP